LKNKAAFVSPGKETEEGPGGDPDPRGARGRAGINFRQFECGF